MRADPRSVLSGRPQAHTPHTLASRAVARRRAVGALGALALLFALTTTGAWAEDAAQDTSTPTPTKPSPSESPSPDPTPTPEPSPSPSPTVIKSPSPSPTPSESTDDEGDDSEEDTDEDEDEDSEDSDEAGSEDGASGNISDPTQPGDPVTEAPAFPTTVAPASFNPALRIISSVIEPANHVEEEHDLIASFEATPESGPAPLTVQFTNTSECPSYDPDCYEDGTLSWEWDFGDGTSGDERFEQNPNHVFTEPGSYRVTMTVYLNYVFNDVDFVDSAAFDPECNCDTTTLDITVEEPNPVDASFTVTPDSGLAPLTVTFNNQSECDGESGCSFYAWDFGNGQTSDERDPPDVTYDEPGNYTVTLTVGYVVSEYPRLAAAENPSCGESGEFFFVYCDTATETITVSGPPEASFTAVPQIGLAPLTVNFTDTSTGDIESWKWTFSGAACGMASVADDTRRFTETFTTPGQCVVTLTVTAPEPEPVPDPGPSFGPDSVAAFDPKCNCDTATKTITVTKPPVVPNNDNDDNDDGDSDDSDDSDDDGDPGPGVFLPNQPPLTGQPTPEPTDPSPAPTSKPVTPVNPTPPTPPTEPDPEPAAWVTGTGASAAGLALMILAAVIGSMRGLSLTGQRVALVADRDENTIQRHVAARDAEGWGDRSFTWRFPGHRLIDAASVVIPDRLFRFSPLVGRIAEDGSEFRAMFGTLWLATPLAGIALGLASASAAGGRALPPSVWLVAAGAVLATFDAFAGAIAVVLFAGAALLGGLGGAEGGPDTVHSLLVILAIGFLWMAIPLIGSAIRPFRRLGDGSLRHRWDVVGDGLIAALLCGWVAQKLTEAMDLFAGQKTGLPEHANTVAIVVMAAVALRVSMEHFAVSAYPRRLQQVEGEDPPSPFLASVVLGAFIRTAVFGFIGYAFIGSCWQLWVGIGLFLIPQLIDHLRERFRNIGFVQRILPRGVVEIFILVVTCTLIARYAMNQTPDEFTGLRMAFLLIAIPPALLGALRVFAEDADESGDSSWARQFLGAIIVAVTAVLAARGWDY